MQPDLLLGFPDTGESARRLAAQLGTPFAEVAVHAFPDGETRVTLPAAVPETVALYLSLDRPNPKAIPLLLTAHTARQLGARQLLLIAPYLAYMRQDMAFHPGEAVSQRIVGGWLAETFDAVVTVDPHLHRVARFDEAVPARAAVMASAAPLMGHFLNNVLRDQPDAVLLGPDEESLQWVAAVAAACDITYACCTKTRLGDHDTTIALPDVSLSGRPVVLVDDIASSAGTLCTAAMACRAHGAASVDAIVVHALFDEAGAARLRAAGIGRVWSSDSIPHPTNALTLAPLLADAVRSIRFA